MSVPGQQRVAELCGSALSPADAAIGHLRDMARVDPGALRLWIEETSAGATAEGMSLLGRSCERFIATLSSEQ